MTVCIFENWPVFFRKQNNIIFGDLMVEQQN
jgi:hypothetical protein